LKNSSSGARRALVLIVVGLSVGCAAVLWPIYGSPKKYRIEPDDFSISGRNLGPQDGDKFVSVDLKFPFEHVTSDVNTEPDNIQVNQSFLLEYVLKGETVSPLRVDPQYFSGPPVAHSANDWLNERLPGAQIKLELGAGTVKPEGFQILSDDLRAVWTVSLPTPLTHFGTVTIISNRLPNGGGSDDIRIVVSPEDTQIDWWFWVVSIIGFLVAVTNLVKFYWLLKEKNGDAAT